ncbi:MAG TPA: oligosaccharide flippase family protein [Thermoanaerobaculia bacterium]|nr:oligosaccharide flippase family protein [Thermoanaerobaculia bacterium]
MSRLTRNFAANFGASIAAALVALLVIPLYVRRLGMEPYGLIAFSIALRAALQVLDLGLAPVVNREVARYVADRESSSDAQDVLYTFQGLYWCVAVLVGAVIVTFAPSIAKDWLDAKSLSVESVTLSVRLIGILIATQWPIAFYQSALLGLERQVSLNGILTAALFVTHACALSLMVWWPRVEIFFLVAIAVGVIQVTALAWIFWTSMPPEVRTFRLTALRHVARFTLGVGAISVTGVILSHMDKMIVSVVLPLERFAHYSMATMIAGALVLITTPVFNTVYPRFSALAAASENDAVRELHHFSTQLVTVAVVPAALTIIFFSRELVEIWTGSAATAALVAPLAMFLVAGAALNGVMTVPYALQLSHAWIRPALIFGVAATLAYLPLVPFLALKFGAEGAALSWLLMNATYFAVMAPIIHRHLLPGSFPEWLGRDVLLPSGCAAAVVAVCAAALPRAESAFGKLAMIAGTYAIAALIAMTAAGRIRNWVMRRIGS